MSEVLLDQWVLEQRQDRNAVDAARPYAYLAEEERTSSGEIVSVNTVFLTNRECPWRCLMCDLWKNTLVETVPVGSITAQIEYALERLPTSRHIKLYNSGSFFDPRAIPVAEYPAIAKLLSSFERVIVESHPALIGENCLKFRDLIPGRLEVAMGLETVHPEVLPRLNKRMTLEQFSTAAGEVRRGGLDLRVFILVRPPYMSETEGIYWAQRSLDFAFDCGAVVACVIPVRDGNGAMEALKARGEFAPPRIESLEECQAYGLHLQRGRVFADLWDLRRFSICDECYSSRVARLTSMNLEQRIPDSVNCVVCGART